MQIIFKAYTHIVVLVFKLLSRKVLLINRKGLLQNYKLLECEIFRILLKHVSDHLSVLFSICMAVPSTILTGKSCVSLE